MTTTQVARPTTTCSPTTSPAGSMRSSAPRSSSTSRGVPSAARPRRRWSTRCCSPAAGTPIRDTVEPPAFPLPSDSPGGAGSRSPTAVLLAAASLAAHGAGWSGRSCPVLRHAGRLRVGRHSCSRRSSSSRRSCPCSASPPPTAHAGPARDAGRHRALRPYPADPAPHAGVLVSVLPVHRPARALPARAGVARRRVARAGPRARAGAARPGQLRRPAGRRRRRGARVERRRARLVARPAGDLAGRGRPSRASTSPLPPWSPASSSRSGPPATARMGAVAVNAVELTGVGQAYGRTRALAAVDLAFDRGVTGLLGPNGAGKTTLLRIVATSIAADRGSVRLLGRDPHGSHAELTAVRRELGYLPQELGYPARHDGLRLRRVRRRPQGVERPRARRPGGTTGARRSSASATWRPSGSPALRRAAPPGRRWRRRCWATRGCSCSTSPRPASTRRSAPTCGAPSPPSARRSPSCSPPTRPRTSPRSASAWSSSPAAPSASTAPSPTSSPPPPAGSGSPTSPAPTRCQLAHRHRPPPRRGRHAAAGADPDRADARGRLPADARRRRQRVRAPA